MIHLKSETALDALRNRHGTITDTAAATAVRTERNRAAAAAFETHLLPYTAALLTAARSAIDVMPPARHHTPGTSTSPPQIDRARRGAPPPYPKKGKPYMAVRTHFTVEHPCGHEVTHDLSNRPADKRAGFARWLASKDCTDCWKAARDGDTASTQEWLAGKRAEEQQAAKDWAQQFAMPPLEGPERALEWGERCRHQLVTAAHTALVVEGGWDEGSWAALEDRTRSISRAGWWIDQRDADGSDLVELLEAATDDDRGTENPFR